MKRENQPRISWVLDPNDSAFPIKDYANGLTKREYFAGLAMQANADNDQSPEQIAEDAVRLADALINALNK